MSEALRPFGWEATAPRTGITVAGERPPDVGGLGRIPQADCSFAERTVLRRILSPSAVRVQRSETVERGTFPAIGK
jgi:hypothetical protein